MDVNVNIRFRPHQLTAWNTETRFAVNVWHRRAGKTYYEISAKLARALRTERTDWRAYYLAPTYKAAKRIAWEYLKNFTRPIPGTEHNEQELRADLPNGARIQLLGAEKYDDLRGLYADDLTLDETALIPSAAWRVVLSPMLADRKGRATFIGTPMGRMNLLHDQWEYADCGDPEWSRSLLTYRDTNVIDELEIARERRQMTEAEFAQEYECSFNAALRGAFYAKEMTDADRRVQPISYDNMLPVVAALDLGYSDAMVAGFWQQAGSEFRCLLAKSYTQTSIPDMIADWRTLPFPVSHVVLPHDARVHELGTGKSRREVFESMGFDVTIAPRQSVHDGIEAVRHMLGRTWFDRDGTRELREALVVYRSEFDDVRNVYSPKPVHDWASHWADMVRYYASGRPANLDWEDNSALYATIARGMV